MTGIDVARARAALADLPEGTSHGDSPALRDVYLPRSHQKAMDPNNMLVIGMRGAGKTFWWSALQNPQIRQLVGRFAGRSALDENTEVQTGFGVTPALDKYPGKDVLLDLMRTGVEPRTIWRTVQAWQLAQDDHPLRQQDSWPDRTNYVADHPEAIERLFQDRDNEFDRKNAYFLILFDALDRCADDWQDMYRAIRGLLQTAIEKRSYRRLRVKVFLRSDQIDESEIGDFPDASKVLSSAAELDWPRHELYGLLWHFLANGVNGGHLRQFFARDSWTRVDLDGQSLFVAPRELIFTEEVQRVKFHGLAGPWMGTDRRRGFPYTWIPNHLGDTEGRVSPRSFLSALRTAAEDTAERRSDHNHALHYDSIKRGVQEASGIRVSEIQEDHPWVHQALKPLDGMVVPCTFREIERHWKRKHLLDSLRKGVEGNTVKLPPRHIEQGLDGVRQDLEALRVFLRMRDGRVNIPDVFRVGYGLGRKGGVRPVR